MTIKFDPLTYNPSEENQLAVNVDSQLGNFNNNFQSTKKVEVNWETNAYESGLEAEENDTWHMIRGYGAGAAVEMGGGLYLAHKLNSSGRYTQAASNSKKLLQSLKALRVANAATWQKSFTPWGLVAQVGGFVVTEMGIWALANLGGQATRNVMGVQEGIHASELISSAVFGSIAQPIESSFALARIGDRINKAMPMKVIAETTRNAKNGVIDLGAWKGRELLVKGVPKFISGAALGLAESTMRQELGLLMNDIEERNKWDYLTSTAAGGAFNTIFGVLSKSGAWGRKQATTVAERARDRTKQAIEDIDKDLAKINKKTSKANTQRANALKVKRAEHEQALEIFEDLVEDAKKADAHLTTDETTPTKPLDQPEPAILKEKKETLANQEKLDPTEPKETINVDKALDETTLDRLLQELEEKWQAAVQALDEGSVTDDIIRTTRKIYEAADYDMGVAIQKLGDMGDDVDLPTLTRLLEDVDTQIKLLDSVHGRINTAAGRAIRANNLNSSPSPTSTYSAANEATKDALLSIKRRLETIIKGEGSTDEFLVAAQQLLEGKKPKSKKTTTKADEAPTVKDGEEPTVKADDAPTVKDGEATTTKGEEVKSTKSDDKGEGIDSSEPETSSVVKGLEKRIARLQKQLDELLPNISGKKVDDKKGKTGAKKEEDPEILRLKKSIANARKYKREAEKVVELELEVARLAKIAERNDPVEMQAELLSKTDKPKESLNNRINAAKERQRAAKKLFRERLNKIVKEERKQLELEAKAKLWDDVYEYVYREAELENAGVGVKLFRTARILRKLGMVNSPTSAMAALPTGAFEVLKLFPKAVISKVMAKTDVESQIAQFELEAAGEALIGLFSKDTWKHFRKAQKTGQDPSFNSSTRFGDEFQTPVARQFVPMGMESVVTNARAAANRAAYGQEATIEWAKNHLYLGKLLPFLSFGARTIIGVDASFKRQLRFAAARLEARKKGVLNHPNDPKKAQEYSDKLLESWQRDAGGLKVLAQVDELADDFARIDDALLMAAHGDEQDVARHFTEEILIKPISAYFNNDRDGQAMLIGAVVELFMPFYKVGVRSVVKSAQLANPFRFVGATNNKILGNPYNKISKDLQKLKDEAINTLENQRKNQSKKWIQNKERQILDYDRRLRLVAERRVKYNKEVLADVLIQLSLGSAAFTAGYMGKATGTNAWMTADQKRNNKDKIKDFTMFGIDYRSAVPVNFLMAFCADAGRYLRAKEEGQLAEEKKGQLGLLSLALDALKTTAQELPTSQGLADIEGIFSGSPERLEQIIVKIAGSYLLPVPSWIRRVTNYKTSGETISELRGGTWEDRFWYNTLGVATPNRKVDIIGQFVENDKTFHHVWNRFAPAKGTERQPYRNIIASDHEGILNTSLPADFLVTDNMYQWRDEEGRTLHQHFAERLRNTSLLDELNLYAETSYLTDRGLGEMTDKGVMQNMGILEARRIINKYYKQVKEDMEKDPQFLFKFVNREGLNLYDEVQKINFQGDGKVLLDKIPKPIF